VLEHLGTQLQELGDRQIAFRVIDSPGTDYEPQLPVFIDGVIDGRQIPECVLVLHAITFGLLVVPLAYERPIEWQSRVVVAIPATAHSVVNGGLVRGNRAATPSVACSIPFCVSGVHDRKVT